MGLFSEKKPYTAISSETETLLQQGSHMDPATLLNLIELIQTSRDVGGHECGRFLRKKLKHGTASDQMRALGLIETIVDNGVRPSAFVGDSGLGDQLVQLAASHTAHSRTDMTKEGKSARQARSLLSEWSNRKDRNLSSLFAQAGLVQKHERTRSRSSAHPDDDLDEDFDEPSNNRYSRNLCHGRNRFGVDREVSRSPSPVNMRGQSLETTVATAHNIATRLTNALIANPEGSRETKTYYRQAKQLRHRIIKLVHDPSREVQSYVGQLLSANEELVAALQAHDAVLDGDKLDERDDHEVVQPRQAPTPLRPPPKSPPQSVVPQSPQSEDGDPFGDDQEHLEGPIHTPMW